LKLNGEDEEAIFKQIVGVYVPQLKRDSAFLEYMDRIGRYYFDVTLKQANPMQEMMANMFGGNNNAP
jgi:hypothetical protein